MATLLAARNRKPARSTWGLHSTSGPRTALGGFTAGRGAAALLAAGWQQASLAFSSANRWRWHFGAHSQPQAGSQHLGAAQQAGAQAAEQQGAGRRRSLGPRSRPGRSSSSRSKDGSRPAWPSAAPRGKDGSSSARSRKPAHSTWGLRSRPRRRRRAHSTWGPRSRPGRSSSSRSKDGSRPAWPSAAPRGKDGSSSEHTPRYNRRPARSLGAHSTCGASQHLGASQQPGPQQIGPSTVGGGHNAQSEEGHRRQQKTTLHGSYSL